MPHILWHLRVNYRVHKNRQLSISWARMVYSTLSHPISLRSLLILSHHLYHVYLTNQLDAQNFCFTISLFHATTCFEHHVLIIRRSELPCTASGIITPIGGRPVHRVREDSPLNLCTGRPPTECDDTRCCIIQFWPPDDEHVVLETCRGMK